MELVFQSTELRTICEKQEQAELSLSPGAARALRIYLADIRASAVFSEVLQIYAPQLEGDVIIMPLADGEYLRLTHSHIHPPQSDGVVDWGKVYRVRIISIGRDDA